MANLKIDLLNKLKNDKYFEENELVRLAQDPNMNYKGKIKQLSRVLEKIIIINAQLSSVEQYFQDTPANTEPVAQQQPPVTQPAPTNFNKGQTHGE